MSNAVCNAVTQRVSYNVRLSSRPDQTRPESLYRSLVVVSGSTSIDLTVGVESPPEAWMDLDDLNLLDDDKTHRCCTACSPPKTWRLLDTYLAYCGRRVLAKGDKPKMWVRHPCRACRRVRRCPKCGA